jgi:cytidine deaminase
MQPDVLLERARLVRANAYAPYSKFLVGAAVRSANGNIYVGCNVENASYGGTVCAERNAIFAMVAAGETALTQVAIFTEALEPAMPCGLCRQVMAEFGTRVDVYSATPSAVVQTDLEALLPHAFRAESLTPKA